MSSYSKQRTTKPDPDSGPQKPQPPAWTAPIFSVSEAISPFFLWVTGILFVVLALMVFMGRTHVSWLKYVIVVFGFCATIGFLALLISRYETAMAGWVCLVIGFAVLNSTFGFAFLAVRAKIEPSDTLVASTNHQMTNIGIYLIIVSVLNLAYNYLSDFLISQARARARKIKYIVDTSQQDTLKRDIVPKCWQMSRCRPHVRRTCPNYIDRRTCWKRRSGCFCDRSLANFLISVSGKGESQEAIDIQRLAGSPEMQQMRDTMRAQRQSWRAQKKLCHECPLYNEHQEYKYKHLSWLTFPITGGIVAACWVAYDWAYQQAVHFLDDFFVQLAQTHAINSAFRPDTTTLANGPFEFILLGVLALLLVSHMIVLTEKCFLTWKL